MVGARGTFAETTDGGKTWFARSFTNLDAEEEGEKAVMSEVMRTR